MRPDKPVEPADNSRGEKARGEDEDPDLRDGCEG